MLAAMNLHIVATLALALVPVLPESGAKDGERIKALLGKSGAKIGSLEALTAAPAATLIARSGITREMLDTMRRYQAEAPGESGPIGLALLDVPLGGLWAGKPVRLGVALAASGEMKAVHCFDDFGKVIQDFEPFLRQFGPDGVALNEASNEAIGDVVKRRDAVAGADKPPVKPQEKKTWTLYRHSLRMKAIGEHFQAASEAGAAGKPLAEPLAALDSDFAALDEFAGYLRAVMEPKTVGQYREQLKALRTDLKQASDLATKGENESAAKLLAGKLKLDCGKCHGFDANEWKRPFETELRRQREAAGFKSGVFVIDVDVRKVGFEIADAQMLAGAVKAACLACRG